MNYSAALPHPVHAQALDHLLRPDGQEDVCFGLWYPSQGADRMTALIERVILPEYNDRRVHGNASFLPQYFERAVSEAAKAGAGLAFLHSHPAPGWQDMSPDDVRAEETHAPAVTGATGLPFVGMTAATDGAWSARFWVKTRPRHYERRWCRSTRVVGERLAVTYHSQLVKLPTFRAELTRTLSAWGPAAQAALARLRVGVVGAGSVGFLVAEALARMGISFILLFDFDRIEALNLDRQLFATREDAALRRPKVEVLAAALRRSATAYPFTVEPLQWSVVEEQGYRSALDCDVLFSCVDRPWPRSILNLIAYAHLIPVVDGGIGVVTKSGNTGLRGADWRAHVAAPTRRCLECLGQYDPGDVSTERDGYFDDPAYIAGLSESHPIKRNENVFAFSMSAASFEVLQMLSMVIAPLGVSNPGAQMYHFVTGDLDCEFQVCNDGCPYAGSTAKGDRTGLVMTARHRAAELARALPAPRPQRTWLHVFRRLWPW
jgi:molybdopterin-synthase adenylyltransferase